MINLLIMNLYKNNGGTLNSYEILNGHHTVQALRSLGKKYVKVKLK